jgi:hypothetical protein
MHLDGLGEQPLHDVIGVTTEVSSGLLGLTPMDEQCVVLPDLLG